LQIEIARGKTAAVATAQGSIAVDDATGIATENAVGVHPVGEFKFEFGIVVYDQQQGFAEQWSQFHRHLRRASMSGPGHIRPAHRHG